MEGSRNLEYGTINSHRPTTLGGQPAPVISRAERQVMALWTVSPVGYATRSDPGSPPSRPCLNPAPRIGIVAAVVIAS
jgi:hypothetical protein